jgi:hypothetical protein
MKQNAAKISFTKISFTNISFTKISFIKISFLNIAQWLNPYPPGENKILTVLPSPLFFAFSTNHLEDSRISTNYYRENSSRDYVKKYLIQTQTRWRNLQKRAIYWGY